MHSAVAALPPDSCPEIYVFDDDLSEESRVRILRVARATGRITDFRWIRIPRDRIHHLKSQRRLTPAAYSRLLIPELVPEHIRRVVYLDSDVLVRRDLTPLLVSLELGDPVVGAVRNFYWKGSTQKADRYYNTGVLVMDVRRWRAMDLTERALLYAATSPEPLLLADQDALNAVLEQWCEIDYRWNVQRGDLFSAANPPSGKPPGGRLRRSWTVYRMAAVLHFTGVAKPWNSWCSPLSAAVWARALLRTGWYTPRQAITWLLGWLRNSIVYWLYMVRTRYLRSFVRRLSAARATL